MRIKRITILEVEYVAYRLARDLMEYNEPIPDFGTRYPNVLESCLATPFQTYGSRVLYKRLIEKASILFYLMVKNHPFENGNKRIALTTLLLFLMDNKKWLRASNEELYQFAVKVAASSPNEKDDILESINKFIRNHLVNLSFLSRKKV